MCKKRRRPNEIKKRRNDPETTGIIGGILHGWTYELRELNVNAFEKSPWNFLMDEKRKVEGIFFVYLHNNLMNCRMKISFKKMTEQIKQSVREIDPHARVYLYGSRARRTAREDSDWDVLILVEKMEVSLKDEQQFRHKLSDVEIETGQTVSTFVYSLRDWFSKLSVTPLFENIEREGILL